MADEIIPLAQDTLYGVKAIAAEIGEDEKRTYYLCSRGYIPAGKLGSLWVGSRQKLREHYDRLTSGVAAAAAVAPERRQSPIIRRYRKPRRHGRDASPDGRPSPEAA